jgi:hypothetical protein
MLGQTDQPLYWAYANLARVIDEDLDMRYFLQLAARLSRRRLLQLWQSLRASRDLLPLAEPPPDLAERYAAIGHDDPSFDPFGMMVSLGPQSPRFDGTWTLEFEWAKATFRLECRRSSDSTVLRQVSQALAVTLVSEHRTEVDDAVTIKGRIQDAALAFP